MALARTRAVAQRAQAAEDGDVATQVRHEGYIAALDFVADLLLAAGAERTDSRLANG